MSSKEYSSGLGRSSYQSRRSKRYSSRSRSRSSESRSRSPSYERHRGPSHSRSRSPSGKYSRRYSKNSSGYYGSAGGIPGRGPAIDVFSKVPITCHFWKNDNCVKGPDRCSYIHAYLCPDKLNCKVKRCQDVHLKSHQTYKSVSIRH